MLEKKIRRYKAMEIHRDLVRKGKFKVAKILLKLLKNNKVKLGLDDDSWEVEMICQNLGCRMSYDSRGYCATAYL